MGVNILKHLGVFERLGLGGFWSWFRGRGTLLDRDRTKTGWWGDSQ